MCECHKIYINSAFCLAKNGNNKNLAAAAVVFWGLYLLACFDAIALCSAFTLYIMCHCYWYGASLLSFVVFHVSLFYKRWCAEPLKPTHVREKEKQARKSSIFLFNYVFWLTIACFLLLQNSYAVPQVCYCYFPFVLWVPLFFSIGQCFFLLKQKRKEK